MAQVSDAGDRGIDAFRPIRVRSAADEVLAVLADAIRGGLYRTGDVLPRERDLAERLGVSRTVVREAIAALRDAGIVTVRRGNNGGTVVASQANLPQILARIAGETRFEFRTLLEVRRGLELQSGLLVAERADDAGMGRLRALMAALADHVGRHQEFYDADVRFHLALAELSGNAMLEEFTRTVFNRIAVLRQGFLHAHVDFHTAIANQRELFEALAAREPTRIARTVSAHVAAFERAILGQELTFMRAVDPPPSTDTAAPAEEGNQWRA